MMKLTRITPEKIAEISDWYWDFGSRRTGAYVLSRGAWLDKIQRTLRHYSDICYSEEHFKRPSVAVWGPSQSGKSTLLASAIDYGEGALNWDGSGMRFVAKSKSDKNSFNPNNRGSDASGCVARYVMREQVEHPEAPIEICFVEERDILMSLAFGYLSEMEGKAPDGTRRYFGAENLRELLGRLSEAAGAGTPRKEYFPKLVAVVDVIEALISAKQERYSNLAAQWEQLRCEIFNCDALLVSSDSVLAFAAEIFWDGWESLTDICVKLLGTRDALREKYGEKRFFCSLKFASILLDIAAAENKDVREQLSGFGECSLGEGEVAFVSGGNGGFDEVMDFALLQALVAVLVVPLKKSVIEKSAPALCELLSTADVVDFPGVANEAKGTEASRLNDEALKKNPLLGLTKVLKRGKTASVVIGYSRNLNIDVFAILMRMNKYAQKPEQLNAGIAAWFDAMLQKPFDNSTAAELPLNIVQTFAAELVNSVRQKAIGKDGLREIFEKNKGFGTLCKAGNAKYFAINYPEFKPECDFSVAGTEELKDLISEIEKDRVFVDYYRGTEESLRQMCGLSGPGGNDGGRSFLFERLLKQVKASLRRELLERKKMNLEAAFNAAAEDALPQNGDEKSRRESDIQQIIAGIESRTSWCCEKISRAILEFSNICPEDLKELPADAAAKSQEADEKLCDYCENVISTVKSILGGSSRAVGSALGLDDQICSRMVAYFMEGISTVGLKKWIRENLSTLSNAEGGRMAARRPLALYLSALLLRRSSDRHRSDEDVQDYLRRAATGEQDARVTAGYVSVVAPFLKTLKKLAEESAGARGYQPGDNELHNIFNELTA